MAWTAFQIIIAVVMVATGSINTLSTKWADQLTSVDSAGDMHSFDHPFLQSWGMFFGEMLCLLTFKIIFCYYAGRVAEDGTPRTNFLLQGSQEFNPFVFFPAAMCDMIGTSIMYVGLTMTYASSFQMLRGAVIVFTAILAIIFLRQRPKIHEWIGIVVIIIGLVTVGLNDILFADDDTGDYTTSGVMTGDILIIVAQVITAAQMVYEAKYIVKLNVPPVQVVGWEGVFGFVVLGILLIPMYFIPVPDPFGDNPRHVLEDALDGFVQLGNNGLLCLAIAGNIISIAFFNFAGVSVTKELSATTRMVLDSVRTIFIWLVTLALGWQAFGYLQLIGFIVLAAGMFLYNNVIIVPGLRWLHILPPAAGASPLEDVTEDVTSSRAVLSPAPPPYSEKAESEEPSSIP